MFDATISKPAFNNGPLPEKTLVKGKMKVTGLKKSQTGNQYLTVEITCKDPHKGHRILERIMLTQDNGSSVSQFGMNNVRSILEANGLTVQNNPESFKFQNAQDVGRAIDGKEVAIKTGLNDKGYTSVKMYLSPCQESGTLNDWNKLHNNESEMQDNNFVNSGFDSSPGTSSGSSDVSWDEKF